MVWPVGEEYRTLGTIFGLDPNGLDNQRVARSDSTIDVLPSISGQAILSMGDSDVYSKEFCQDSVYFL